MDDQLLLFLTIGGLVILLLMVVVIRVGLKNSGADDLMDVPPPEDMLDKSAAGQRISILPERPDVVVEKAPSVLNPERPKDDTATDVAAGPWENQPKIGDQETESGYSEDQLMEREIEALLLQSRPDRAVAHVMAVKKIDEAEAERIVARHIEPGQG